MTKKKVAAILAALLLIGTAAGIAFCGRGGSEREDAGVPENEFESVSDLGVSGNFAAGEDMSSGRPAAKDESSESRSVGKDESKSGSRPEEKAESKTADKSGSKTTRAESRAEPAKGGLSAAAAPRATEEPTKDPPAAPRATAEPTKAPTAAPRVTAAPTKAPTAAPGPTAAPTETPTEVPAHVHTWETITGNCDITVYLGGNELSTHKYISELLGKYTIDKKSSGETMGSRGSASRNIDALGRDLMSPNEVRKMDNKKCLIFVKGY
ncbi:MAG: TraM recognition domain-containing protein, partial [Lachnospiraceae bacterium]|nr:TraM recognition domain-containing protein [Lachnospiraceae bacterium]